jgi:serine/threonine-protein kinase
MDHLGRYQILGELGRGAMGVVFRALDPSIGREVAIKTIRLSELANAEQRTKQRERLFREARSAGILSHPSMSR